VLNLLLRKKRETLEGIVTEIQKDDLDLQNQLRQEYLRKEILCYQKVLKDFGLRFETLVEQSPKDIEGRKYTIMVAKTLIKNEDLKKTLFQKKKIPVKELEKLVSVVNKNIIEQNHKYIIAIAILLAGDYVYLKDYIKGCWNHQL
jgi:RNA polymerase sigma factor